MGFYHICKRRGCSETLFTLYSSKNYGCTLSEFFEILEQEKHSYYNAFFRVKEDLLTMGLIEYGRNRNKEKIIRLTSKGVKIVRILREINQMIDRDYEVYNQNE